MADFLENYRKTHTHPINKALHTVGIPMIVISIIWFIIDALAYDWAYLYWTIGLFVLGWVLQFIGHWYEGKPPAFFSNPIYLIIGPFWWVLKVLGFQPKPSNKVNKND